MLAAYAIPRGSSAVTVFSSSILPFAAFLVDERRASNLLGLKLMPAIGSQKDIIRYRGSKATAVVLRVRDRGFVFAPVFNPGLQFLVPGVSAD